MTEKPKEQKSELALLKKDIVDVVSDRINQLVGHDKFHLPKNYSAENALMAAWLKLQSTTDKDKRLALTVCTRDSVANALLDMIVQGLTPAKDQCYFVVYGNKLVCLRSYFGDEALLRRVYPGARVFAEPVYKGDELEYEIVRGKKMITKHAQKLANVGGLKSIIATYAIVELGEHHEPHCEIMTLEQIEKAWAHGQNWPPRQGKQSPHTDHPEEFVKKTVIARACKRLINSSDDSCLIHAVERQAHLVAETEMQARVEEEANQNVIDLPPAEPVPAEEPRPRGAGAEEKPGGAQPEEAQEESASSPSARFLEFIDEHELNAPKARKLAGSICKIKDVRNMGNKDYEAILNNAKDFLARYRQKYPQAAGGATAQPKLDGPGF